MCSPSLQIHVTHMKTTNDDEHDLDDLFEDFELMKIDGQVYWSLKLREKALYIYSSYFSTNLLKCYLYCI
jgi:hypothetical protein